VSTRLLREVDWGRWTGRSLKELQEKYPGLLPAMEKAGWAFRPPGGEDRNEVWERAHCALKRAARKWPERTVLVVAHEGVLQCLVQRLCKRRFLPNEPPLLKSGYLQRLAYGGEGLKIEKLNAVALPD
jgi:probable phosphoglycerate mutase